MPDCYKNFILFFDFSFFPINFCKGSNPRVPLFNPPVVIRVRDCNNVSSDPPEKLDIISLPNSTFTNSSSNFLNSLLIFKVIASYGTADIPQTLINLAPELLATSSYYSIILRTQYISPDKSQ